MLLPKVIQERILYFLQVRDRLNCLHINKDWCVVVTDTFINNVLPCNWLDIFRPMGGRVNICSIKVWLKLPWNHCWKEVELVGIPRGPLTINLEVKLPTIVQNDFYSKSKVYRGKTMVIDLNHIFLDTRNMIAPIFVKHVFDKAVIAPHSDPSHIIFPKFIKLPFTGDYWRRCLVDINLEKHIWKNYLVFAHLANDTNNIMIENVWCYPYIKHSGWHCGVVDWREYENDDRNCNLRQVPVWVDVTQFVYSNDRFWCDQYFDVLKTGDSMWVRLYFSITRNTNVNIAEFGTHTCLKQQCRILATPLFINNAFFDYKTSKFLQKQSLKCSDIINDYIIDSPHLEWDFLFKNEMNLKNLLCIRQYNGLLCLGCFIKYSNDFWLISENNEKFRIDGQTCQTNPSLSMIYKGIEMYKNNIICMSIDEYMIEISNNNGFMHFWNDWLTVRPLKKKMCAYIPVRVRIPYFFIKTKEINDNCYEWVGNNNNSAKIDWNDWSDFYSIPVNSTIWRYGISYDREDDITDQNGCVGVWIDMTEEIKQIPVKLWKNNTNFVANKQKTKVFGKFYVLFEGSDEIEKL